MEKAEHGLISADEFILEQARKLLAGQLEVKLQADGHYPTEDGKVLLHQCTLIGADGTIRFRVGIGEEPYNCYPSDQVKLASVGKQSEQKKAWLRMEFRSDSNHAGIQALCANTHAISLCSDDYNFGMFAKNSTVYQEYERRWSLEAAHERKVAAEAQIARLTRQGCLVPDEP